MPPKLNSSELNKLKKFLINKAQLCIHEPQGRLPYRYVTPTYGINPGADDLSSTPERSLVGHYLQMYDWDACFFSQVTAKAQIAPGLAQNVVANFLSLKEESGYIPRTISPARIWDLGDICKPFLAQALLHEQRTLQSASALSAPSPSAPVPSAAALSAPVPSVELLKNLDHYLKYFRLQRAGQHGLFRWRNVLESGVDDNLALLAPEEAAKDENETNNLFPDGMLLATDLNAYLYAEFSAFSQLATNAGLSELAREYAGFASELKKQVEDFLYSSELGLYCNLHPQTGKQVELRSWTGLAPALFGLANEERIEEIIRRNILNPDHFYRPCGLVSTAVSEPLCNQSKRGLYGRAIVSNWQGPVWILPNALVCRLLLAYEFKQEAIELSLRVLSTMLKGLNETGTLFENYHAETGEPLWAPQFISWNILALEMIELVE